ncbi:MAG: NACHT domain-containing protein [Thermoanaerobaculia bacterium]
MSAPISIEQVREAVVNVRGASSGTGFFVLPGVVATVRHVTGDGSLLPEVHWNGRPLTVSRVRLAAHGIDLALIDVIEREHPVLPLSQAEYSICNVFAFGFQYGARGYKGYPVFGKSLGPARDPLGEILVIADANIQPGLSGGPAVAVDGDGVIGIILRDNPDGGGYALPIRALKGLAPSIVEDNNLVWRRSLAGAGLRKYFDAVLETHADVRLIDSDRALKIDDVFVSLSFASGTPSGHSVQRSPGGTPLATVGRRGGPTEGRRDLGAPQKVLLGREARLSDVLARRRVALLGDPGMGKTTLLKYLLVRIARGDLVPGVVPIFVPLDELDASVGAIERYIRSAWPDVAEYLIDSLRCGTAFLLCDGLDEVPLADVARLRGELARLTGRDCRVAVSCRTVAYGMRTLGPSFPAFECVGFNTEQQQRFLARWFGSTAKGTAAHRAIRANSATASIARTPLLLALAAAVLEKDPAFALPARRVDIYSAASRLLLERRVTIEPRLNLPVGTKETILKSLCRELFARGKEIFSEEELLAYLAVETSRSADPLIRQTTAKDWRDVLVAQDGIITPVGRSTYRFVHLTIQEYYTARSVLDERDWRGVLEPVLLSPRWEEVVRFAAAHLTPAAAGWILRSIWKARAHSEDTVRVLLAARCASDVAAVEEEYLEALVSRLIAIVCDDFALDPIRDQATIALGLVASTHMEAEVLVNSFFRNKLEDGQSSLALQLRYFEVLRNITSEQSASYGNQVLLALADRRELDLEREAEAQLVAAVLRLVGEVGDTDSWKVVFPFLARRSSYVRAAAAEALLALQTPAVTRTIMTKLEEWRGDQQQLGCYIVLKNGNAETGGRILRTAMDTRNARLLMWWASYLAEDVSLPAPAVLSALLSNAGPVSAGLSSVLRRLPVLPDDVITSLLDEDRPLPLSVLAQAADHAVMASGEVWRAFLTEVFSRPRLRAVRAACLNAAAAHRDPGVATPVLELMFQQQDPTLLASAFRMIAACRLEAGADWIRTLIDDGRLQPREALAATQAIAAVRGDEGIPLLARLFAGELRERVTAYRTLGEIASETAVRTLLREAEVEPAIPGEAALLEALAATGAPEGGPFLCRCLDQTRWPKCWPPIQAPVRRGEQRASDRRKLAAVAGVHALGEINAIPTLERIIQDSQESTLVKSAAATTLDDLRFAQELLILEEIKQRAS